MSRMPLPVIVGFGGFNAAGRSSFHHMYRRMVQESLPTAAARETVVGLAVLTGRVRYDNGLYKDNQGNTYTFDQVVSQFGETVLERSLVRRIEPQYFDVDAVHWHKNLRLGGGNGDGVSFTTLAKELPEPIPANWRVEEMLDGRVRVEIIESTEIRVDSYRCLPVQAAGQLPTGLNPEATYNSRFHPRGLQMALMAASDAVHSTGVPWSDIVDAISPDDVGVYAGSVLSQLDENSNVGLLQARLRGGRVSSKQLALGLSTMPADFINAYVLGSVGATGSAIGACATFLYNLRQGIEDIQSGRRRVVLVGGSEAPIVPEIIEGFDAMSALATDANLRKLDNSDEVDYRRASRPFGENCGFVIGESAQYVMLMDDELALNLGAQIFGAVPHVFINADGFKKSISAPGPGNYVTLAKTVAATRAIVGDQVLAQRSLLQAHGSSTPQNRVSESQIFDSVARAFAVERWPVAAVKAYLGHSVGPASADQLIASLGIFHYGLIPGIKTIDRVADDVCMKRLAISNRDQIAGDETPQVAFLNSKGFGGNNASASVLAPSFVEPMLEKRHGKSVYKQYLARREGVQAHAQAYEQRVLQGDLQVVYHFGQDMIDETQIEITDTAIKIPGFKNPIPLCTPNPYDDMV